MSEIDVDVVRGNVAIRLWDGEYCYETHSLTPTKARELAGILERIAAEAEQAMPSL